MKKISKININSKNIQIKWHIKLLFIILCCVLIVMIAVLIKFYIDVNKKNNQSYPDMNILTDVNKNNYKIIRNDNGLLGVSDNEDRSVIEPQWDNIYFLNSNRFAVQKKINNVTKMGIIDSDENCITPFIYKKIISVGDNYLAGYFENEEGFSLFDTSGNIVSDKKWLEYKYDKENQILILTDENGKFSYKDDNGKLICKEVIFSYKLASGDTGINIKINNEKILEDNNTDSLIQMADVIHQSYKTVFDKNNVSQDINKSVIAENLFENCIITNISDINIVPSDSDAFTYIASSEITYNYDGNEKKINDLKSFLSLTLIKDGNSIILKSINKEEF